MANVPMTSAQFRDAYTPVLIDYYKMGEERLKPQWSEFVDTGRSRKLQIQSEVLNFGLGVAQQTPEGSPIINQGGGEAYRANWNKAKFTVGFAVTEEMMEYNEFLDVQAEFGPEMKVAQNEALEINAANVLNYAFTTTGPNGTSSAIGDGQSYLSSTHPLNNGGGNASNILATAANLSEAALEQLTIQIMNAVDQTNRPINLDVRQLIIPNAYVYQADRILKSYLRSGTANNDINALKMEGAIPKIQLARRLTSNTAWFLQTNARQGLMIKWGWKDKVSYEGDFPTGNMRGKSTAAYAIAPLDWRSMYGTAGV